MLPPLHPARLRRGAAGKHLPGDHPQQPELGGADPEEARGVRHRPLRLHGAAVARVHDARPRDAALPRRRGRGVRADGGRPAHVGVPHRPAHEPRPGRGRRARLQRGDGLHPLHALRAAPLPAAAVGAEGRGPVPQDLRLRSGRPPLAAQDLRRVLRRRQPDPVLQGLLPAGPRNEAGREHLQAAERHPPEARAPREVTRPGEGRTHGCDQEEPYRGLLHAVRAHRPGWEELSHRAEHAAGARAPLLLPSA
mmetsp:Transcript_4092/g.11863  ORF Transcript_4092/g.11863 Transcript_4092/m.11863 type:complete len:251 (-) Transcript_4092:255-1007(-)